MPSLCVKFTDTLFPPAICPGSDKGFPQPEADTAVEVAAELDVIFVVLVVKVVELPKTVEDAEPELSNLAPQTPLFACAACTVLFI